MKTISIILIAALFTLAACSEEEIPGTPGIPGNPDGQDNTDDNGWLIPFAEVRDGGPGKDGIPALNEAKFLNAQEATFLADNDLILGFVDGDDVRAYPHSILDWHEIINDDTKNHSLAIIYCPLTGTGIGWNRMINETKTTFGVSGLLYNTNIIPYDRLTDSNWSQLLLKSVNGNLSGTVPKTYNLVETTWKTWIEMYPSTKVVSTETGYNRTYGKYPYGSYKTNKNLIFPISNKDDRLHEKERVLAVIVDGNAGVFRFEDNLQGFKAVNRSLRNTKLVVVKNTEMNLMVAFNRILADGTELSFSAVQNKSPVILLDYEGTKWDIFGRGISGPRKDQKLVPLTQMMGYWFSFATFYPDVELL